MKVLSSSAIPQWNRYLHLGNGIFLFTAAQILYGVRLYFAAYYGKLLLRKVWILLVLCDLGVSKWNSEKNVLLPMQSGTAVKTQRRNGFMKSFPDVPEIWSEMGQRRGKRAVLH